MSKVNFGWLSEGVIIAFLPNHPIHCSKVKARSYYYDIEWHGIKIEVKSAKILGNRYTFTMPKRLPHPVWKNQTVSLSHVVNPDVYAFIGWNKDNIRVWIVPWRKMKHKTSLVISENKKWIYEVKNFADIPLMCCKRSYKKFDSVRLQPETIIKRRVF